MATNDVNRQVIEEFRANAGRVGGNHEGRPLLLLTTTGRKTGRTYATPIMYLADGDGYCVFASKGGAPEHRSGPANLNSTISGNSGHDAGLKAWRKGVF